MTNLDATSPTIAIIGGGFSGVMVAVQLLRYAVSPLKIYLIECKPSIGTGIAYSTTLDCHLLNVPAGKMSAFPDEPNHFVNWLQQSLTLQQQTSQQQTPQQPTLQQQIPLRQQWSASSFVPRYLYGKYIQALLNDAINQAVPGVHLERIMDEAVAIHSQVDWASVVLKGGKTIVADRVVLALGNFAPSHPCLPDPTLYQSERYHASAWSMQNFAAFAPDETVMLIGSGLTAIDVVAGLYQQGHHGKIILLSRHGLLPQPHRSVSAYSAFTNKALPKRLSALMSYIRKEIKSAAMQGYDWRSVLDALRPVSQALWQNLTPAEQRRFLRHLRPYWETHRHRIAPAIAQMIDHLQKIGQLEVYAGRMQFCQEDEFGINVKIQERCSKSPIHFKVHHLVNCTGSELNCDRLQNPLMVNLLQSGLVQSDPLKVGVATATNGALINAEGKGSSHLYTLGCLRKGQLWETTAVPEIRQQAQALAQLLRMQVTSPGAQPHQLKEVATLSNGRMLLPLSSK